MRYLIIEPDNHRRRELLALLDAPRDAVLAVDDYHSAAKWLRRHADDFGAIVLGWPEHTVADADEVLSHLDRPALRKRPVLMIGQSRSPAALDWAGSRPNGAFLLWSERARLTETLALLEAPLSEADAKPAPPPSARILLVDDSSTARVRYRRLLQEAGYTVEGVGTPEEALERAAAERFDVAILDYFMPEMNGDELCIRLQRLPADRRPLCAILTSGYTDKVIRSSLRAGAMDCLFKNEAEELFLTRIAALARDVSMHRHMQEKQEQLQGILASVGDGVYGVNREGIITYVNPAVSALLGYSEAELLSGITPQRLFHTDCADPDQPRPHVCHLREAIESADGATTFETRFLHADGHTIEVELTVQPLKIGGRREGAVVAFRDISERKLLENELKWQANHDPLTRLFNRKYLHDALEREIQRLQRSDETSALLYLDLDRFKYINDTIGHTAGDQLLVELADALHQRVRKADLLARIGGDEFALLLHNIDAEQVYAAADEYRKLLEAFTFQYEGRHYNIHGSIGVALIDRHAESPDALLSAADLACHIAKGKGRNMTHVYDNADRKHTMDLDLGWTRRLHRALERNAFELVYQPIVSLQSLNLEQAPQDAAAFQIWLLEQAAEHDILYECLLRLRDRQGRLISPNAFLPTAERFNMMADIDRWVIEAALSRLEQAHQAGQDLQLSVNLSGQCMSRPDMIEQIRGRLENLQAPTANLLLEITESCAIRHLQAAHDCIESLRQNLGVRFAIDDFGTGYSTLSQLKHLPVDFIKIDGQFIRDIETDPTDLAIVHSIVQIAHTTGKRTVAEFVESLDVLKRLQECGVDYAQGFFLSPPRIRLPEPAEPDHQQVVEITLPKHDPRMSAGTRD